jgi:hypothetical protein
MITIDDTYINLVQQIYIAVFDISIGMIPKFQWQSGKFSLVYSLIQLGKPYIDVCWWQDLVVVFTIVQYIWI